MEQKPYKWHKLRSGSERWDETDGGTASHYRHVTKKGGKKNHVWGNKNETSSLLGVLKVQGEPLFSMEAGAAPAHGHMAMSEVGNRL